MKNFLKALVLTLLFLPHAAFAVDPNWTTVGFDFRDTAGYVTDAADDVYVRGPSGGSSQDQFPTARANTTGKTITFGYVQSLGGSAFGDYARDRDSAVTPRLAGMNFFGNAANPAYFKVTLPISGGTYSIRLAIGETGSSSSYQCVRIMDSSDNTNPSTALLTVTDTDGTAADHYDDSTGTDRTEAAWPGSNVATNVTFTSTTAFVSIGCATSQTGDSRIAHVSFTQVGGGATGTKFQTMRNIGHY